MRSFVPFLLSLILGTALSQEFVTTIEEGHRGLCSPAITADKTSYSSGESIKPVVTICTGSVEWIGIYQAGSAPGSGNAVNWQYTCGGQSCASPQVTGTFQFEMFAPTAGSLSWPLPTGSYQVFYMSGAGVVAGSTFSVGTVVAPPSTGSRRPVFRALFDAEAEN